ncbi:MAG: NAD(P)/FAD-dependent oxidoreductase [Planctomycetota bacterium]|jgi:phytoene dehydrogenase-like protein|nr:NAD(P)/FAD-dependent oxidoreductase [Planctomycetota bacterium]
MLLKSIHEAAERYDAVVIGGGLGGMTAAKRLADAGRSVLLVEGYSMLGGYATYFRRKEHIFDVALHAFPYGMFKTLRKYWSRDLADRVRPLSRIRYDNPQFSLQTTFEAGDFTRIMAETFGVDAATSGAFFAACRNADFYNNSEETAGAFLDRHFPGRPDVVRLLLETVAYATGTTLEDPAIAYAIIFSNFVQRGTHTFIGGTDYLLAEMQRLLLSSGVDIVLKTTVDEIRLDLGKAAGVVAGGAFIESRVVVSNGNLLSTAFDMLPKNALPPEFSEEMRRVSLSQSVAQCYIGIKEGVKIPEIADILFSSGEPAYDAAAYRAFPPHSFSYSFYYPGHIRPEHRRTEIVASMGASYDEWGGLDRNRYAEKKRLLAETVIRDLDRHIPGVYDMADHIEVATPKTLERYTGHRRGASFGTKFPGFRASERLSKVIPGLFHCGSEGIIMSGWLGSANSGAIVGGKADAYLE